MKSATTGRRRVLPTRALDAGTISPLNDEGRWSDSGALDDAALAALDDGAVAVFLPAWQAVLAGAPTRTPEATATIPTGLTLTLWLAQATPVSRLGITKTIRPGTIAVAAANPYRGTHRGADAVSYAPEAAQVIDELAETGTPPRAPRDTSSPPQAAPRCPPWSA